MRITNARLPWVTTRRRPRGRTLAALLAVAALAVALLALHTHTAANASARSQARIATAADDTAGSDPSQYTNTAGVYIGGDPMDLMGNYLLCTPSIPTCPQSPYVPNHLGWVQDCGAAWQPDACGYVFDHAISNQIIRYAAAGTVGTAGTALSAACGPAAALCGGASWILAQGVSDFQNYLPAGRCLYLHLVDDTDVATWLNAGINSMTPVGVRIMDCPA